MRGAGLAIFLAATISSLSARAENDDAKLQFFENKIRPLLAQHCYKCHSAESKKLKAHLYVDSLGGLLKGGDNGPAIIPGKPEKSLLVEAVSYSNVDMQMPPDDKLPAQQIADLTEWVKMGAPWPQSDAHKTVVAKDVFDIEKRRAAHWSWQPVQAHQPPKVTNAGWARSPIDHFILAKLEEKNLAPASAADKRALIRRAYFDLTGLPPPPEATEAFVNDASPQAFEKIVDSLLASPQFGERWARHWLDLVRYAETLGHEFDFANPNAHRYRDYVIRALNADLPYDQFVTEHVAGDLLEKPRLNKEQGFNESVIATGYYFLGEEKHSPVDVRQAQADRFDNMIDITGKTFLGLTVACARCHDHKFDAISTADYYSLYGFLKSSRFTQAAINPHKAETQAKELAALKQDITKAAASRFSEPASQIGKYLLASHEVLHGTPKDGDGGAPKKMPQPDIVFEDFESATYEGWTATGDAFEARPSTQESIAEYQGNVGAHGKGFVNSHNGRHGKGDTGKGTLTSKPFAISRQSIAFLIGGGAHKGKTCLNLLVDGKIARSATGKNDNLMQPGAFDVADLQGRQARLQIVDNESGGWGNIGVDHIVFTDNGAAAPMATARPVSLVAQEFGLNAAMLERWVNALKEPLAADVSHPLYAWTMASQQAAKANGSPASAWDKVKSNVQAREEKAAAAPARDGDVELGNFTANAAYKNWYTEDQAFGGAPAVAGEAIIGKNAERPIETVLQQGGAHSAVLSRRLEGVLRSPTFTINKRYIHVLAAGHEARMNVIIENFVLIRNPIYGGLRKVIKSDKPAWHTIDLEMWKGRDAYLELADWTAIDMTESSSPGPDAYIAVQRVLLSDHGAPPVESTPAALALVGDAAPDSMKNLAGRYQNAAADALDDWKVGAIAAKPVAGARAAWLGFLIERDLLNVPNPGGPGDALAPMIQRYHEIEKAIAPPERTLAMSDGPGQDERVFIRGIHKTLGPVAPRRLLEAITPKDAAYRGEGSGRMELARRITDPANPFTTRVMVNRLWHHLFGKGIVPSVDNFGVLGEQERPAHGDLLDFLAKQFVADGWSVKKSIRAMMLTATYQMSSHGNGKGDEIDPENRLLHHANVRRLQGEAIRDAILSISGRLNPAMYGPSVNVHLTPFMDGRGKPASGPVDGDGRRSIYLAVRRNFLSPMLMAFDTPAPFNSMGRRNVSNVPAQALALLNDPFVIQQAQQWAARVLADKKLTPPQRVTAMYMSAFARPPGEAELAAALAFLEKQAQDLNAGFADVRVWADLAHALINSKEFIFLD